MPIYSLLGIHVEAGFPRSQKKKTSVPKGLAKLGNIVAEIWFLAVFPGVAKLAGNKQNVLLPQWLNEETLSRKTNGQAYAV